MKLVTFTTNKNTDVVGITKIIKSQSTWACIGTGTWLVGGNLRYDELRDLIIPFNPSFLLVIPFDMHHWAGGGLSTDLQKWLNNNLTYED